MYELVTVKLPFIGENAVEIALKQMKEPIPSVREIDETIYQSVENIILKACAKNPKNRYESVRDMYYDLCKCLDEENHNVDKIKYVYPEVEDSGKVIKEEKKEEVKEEVEATHWLFKLLKMLFSILSKEVGGDAFEILYDAFDTADQFVYDVFPLEGDTTTEAPDESIDEGVEEVVAA